MKLMEIAEEERLNCEDAESACTPLPMPSSATSVVLGLFVV